MHVLVSGYKITALPFSFHQYSDQRNGPHSEQRLSFMATESSEFSSDTFTSSLSSPHFPSAPPPPLSPLSFRPPFPFSVLSFPYLPSFCLLLTPSSPLHPINPSSSPSVLPSGSALKSHLSCIAAPGTTSRKTTHLPLTYRNKYIHKLAQENGRTADVASLEHSSITQLQPPARVQEGSAFCTMMDCSTNVSRMLFCVTYKCHRGITTKVPG